MSTPDVELRSTRGLVEIRSGSRVVGGYAAVYNKASRPLGAFIEMIEPRAFAKAQGDNNFANVIATLEHRPELLLGTVSAGTLEISLDNVGMGYQIDLPNTSAGNDTLAHVSVGNIRHSSFEFRCREDDFTYNGTGLPTRHLVSVEVISVSPVSNPAYLDSSVSLRSFATQFADGDIESVIRDAEAGDLRRYFKRSDIPTPLAVAKRSVKEDNMDNADLKARLAKNAAAMQGGSLDLQTRLARNAAATTTMDGGLDYYRRSNNNWAAKIAAENSIRAERPTYQPVDPNAAARQQAAEVLALATQRRINQLAEQGIDVPDTSTGSQWVHPSVGQAPVTQRQQGWLNS